MTAKKFFRNTVMVIFILAAFGAVIFLVFPFPAAAEKEVEYTQSRVIIPQSLDFLLNESTAEQTARIEQMTLKAPLAEGEILAALLTEDMNGDLVDEQIIAYRSLLEQDSPIYLTYIEWDQAAGGYSRVWTSATAATQPGTLSLYTQDLIGDRGVCVILSGINNAGEHTLTIFRKNPSNEGQINPPFAKIAEFSIDGSININVAERTQAYQMGLSSGASFSVSTYGRDDGSPNIMDQIEITYNFNENANLYELARITSIPGAQIEEQKVREILASQQAFEEYVTGLWYYVSPQGTLDARQYIYFDPAGREIIFYGDENQQIFIWQSSYATRYGLSIRSQNISVSTMRRSIDIELESLDSIRIRASDDVRLNFGVSMPWDGSYRKAGNPQNYASAPPQSNPFINAAYNSHLGKIQFFSNGNFELSSGENIRQGKYAFYYLDEQELLELRSYESRTSEIYLVSGSREIYLVETANDEQPDEEEIFVTTDPRKTIALSRILLGARGIQRLHEGIITLNLIE